MNRQKFGRYEVKEEIGGGAMGRVYRCVDPLMRRTVAVKTVKAEYLSDDTAEEYLRRFRREAQAAGVLAHPNIVSIFDVGEDYFVMEYLDGVTLFSILKERTRLPLEEALTLLAPIAEALDYAHRSRVVHRDIKPANIMVQPDGRPKLMDFGVAHLESSIATANGQIFGSPSYMAPEQVAGREITSRADLFAFAVVAYEMITGQRPFQGDSITSIIYRVVNEEPPPPRQWDVELPAVYDDIFRSALRKSPNERYPDAATFVTALQLREFDTAMLVVFPPSEPPPSLPAGFPVPGAVTPSGASAPAPSDHDLRYASAETHALGSRPFRSPRRSALWVAGLALMGILGSALWFGQRAGRGPGSQAEAAPGPFRIESEPDGASVWIDDQPSGATPVALAGLPFGRHKVRVVAEGFAPAELSLEISPGDPPLRFVMDPIAARLVIASEPTGARVLVDGAAVGETPLEAVAVAPGRHLVRVEKRGFAPFSKAIEAAMGQAHTITAVLGPAPTPPPHVALRNGSTPPSTLSPSWVEEGDLATLDASVVPPRKISGEPAIYPEFARRLGMLGTVRLEMIVDEHGQPQDIRIAESAGTILDQAVLLAVRSWRYEPARKNGVKVKVRWSTGQSFMPAR